MGLVTADDIGTAARRVSGLVVRTPLLPCEQLSEELGCRVLVKPENLQHTGSFKVRGALNAMLSWAERGELPAGVVTFSAGNHAAAVAWAGRLLGVRAVVAMPANAQRSKVENVRRFGGEIVPTVDLMGTCLELGRRHGYPAIYPFDMPEVIAGQGTVGREIVEDEPEPDLVVVPVGGGGLISGVATAVKSFAPRTRVVGVEPEVSDAFGQAMRAGKVVEISRDVPTLADGLTAPFAGEHTLRQASVYVDELCVVSERDIAEAWRSMMAATRLVLEPSAVVGLAALRAGAVSPPSDGSLVIVASGGNTDMLDSWPA